MSYSFRHTNPKLAGILIKEAVRCGKQNCRCMKNKRLHKWYYYLYWRDYKNKGLLKKEYVPRTEVGKLRRRIKVAKQKDNEEKISPRELLALFKEFLG